MAIFLALLAVAIGLLAISGFVIHSCILVYIAIIIVIIGTGQFIPYSISRDTPVIGKMTIKFYLPLWKKLWRLGTPPTLHNVLALIRIEYPDGWVWTTNAIWENYSKEIDILAISNKTLHLWQINDEGGYYWLSDESTKSIPKERLIIPIDSSFHVFIRSSDEKTLAQFHF